MIHVDRQHKSESEKKANRSVDLEALLLNGPTAMKKQLSTLR